MEDIHNFSKGLHTDFDEQNQPELTYRAATNWIRLEDGSLTNEQGTLIVEDYPVTLTPLGSAVLDGEVILLSYSEVLDEIEGTTISSEIGIIDTASQYVTIVNNPDLGFLPTHIFKVEVKKDYRGHRIINWVDVNGSIPARRMDLDDVPLVDIDSNTRAFLDYTLPVITVDSITEDGNLPSGIYQFSTRLVTATGNRTSTSLLTNIVPIVDEAQASGSDLYDGNLPQTESFKAINLSISNIDTNFDFIDIIVTTYEGLTNTVVSRIADTKVITGSSMEFKYYSTENDGEELTLDEITVEPLSLDYPKTIAQKDNHLIYGNLQATQFDSNLQAIANSIVSKYIIEELPYSDSINDSTVVTAHAGDSYVIGSNVTVFGNYKEGLNTTNFKGYLRGEVYSFAIFPIYKNGSTGYAYHIPGNLAEEQTPANTTTKLLGTYISSELYPEGYNFPVGLVRHHRMPTMYQETIYSNTDIDTTSGNIRVLGVKFENIDFSSLDNSEDIVGYGIVRELRTDSNKSILAQGIAQPVVPADSSNPSGARVVAPYTGKIAYTLTSPYALAFYSPETTILRNNMVSADKIEAVAYTQGRTYVTVKDTDAFPNNGIFATFRNIIPFSSSDVTAKTSIIDRSKTSYIEPLFYGYPKGNTGTDYKLTGGVYSNGYLHLAINNYPKIYVDDTTKDLTGGKSDIQLEDNGVSNVLYLKNVAVDTGLSATYISYATRNIFNLVSTKTSQYGSVLDKDYILVNYQMNTDTSIECFGGDTFINKTAIMVTSGEGHEDNILGDQNKTLNYFFCESSVNIAYRHYTDGLPYFPKYKQFYSAGNGDGLFQYNASLGHSSGYNKQYSFDNVLKKFYSKSLIQPDEVTRFENRLIYSEQSIEGEQFDAYRVFLANNYHDIPKNKGEITNIFVHQNDLYIHTRQSLWKSSFNERVTQTSSAGEVVLGNGGKFPRPSLEMFPQSGGYAGSIDPLATIVTPYGTFFTDRLQNKIFILGSSFDEVDAGIGKDLIDQLGFAHYVIAAFDYLHDRLLITGINSFTLSYYPRLKSYTANHTYIPTHMVSVNTRTFIGKQGYMGKLNEGNYGEYLGDDVEPASITIISNKAPLDSKTYDSLAIHSNIPFTELEVNDEDKTINKNLVEDDNWEFEPASNEQRITKKNSEYRLSIPLDEDDRRIKGKYSSLKLDYNNLGNEEFIVKYIKVNYRINAR